MAVGYTDQRDARRLVRRLELQYHDGHDHRRDRVRIGGQPLGRNQTREKTIPNDRSDDGTLVVASAEGREP
jgi:hypothetical protein